MISKKVTLLLVVRDEARYIRRSLGAVLAQDYPADFTEIMVLDGMSRDNTRDIVTEMIHESQTREPQKKVVLLENKGRIVSSAFNTGMEIASGDIIILVGGHCEIAADYVTRCVESLEQTGAACVGGAMVTEGENFLAQAISFAQSSRFGVGGVAFRTGRRHEGYVDTVVFGAYLREVVEKLGFFDEELVRNQDDEYNYRLIHAGYKIWFDPRIQSVYYSRPALNTLARQYFGYGYWKVRVMQKHPLQMQKRHFIPPLFVAVLAGAFAVGIFYSQAWIIMGVVTLVYLAAALAASFLASARKGWRFFWIMPFIYPVLHISYGVGFWAGMFTFSRRWTKGMWKLSSSVRPIPVPSVAVALDHYPYVSVIMAVYNEAEHIRACLSALLSQDYPKDSIEILVADGLSTDGTREILRTMADRGLRMLENPGKSAASGLNTCIRAARGEIIVRVDGHTIVERDYVRSSVEDLSRSGADNVGGRMRALGEGYFGETAAIATSSVFGVGSARFHYSDKEEWVDTVYLGAWSRTVFEKIGLFDESLYRNQDDELNYRLLDHGGHILLSPRIRSVYFNRTTPFALIQQYFGYGWWKTHVLWLHPRQARLRQLIPPLFVLIVVSSLVSSVLHPLAAGIGLKIVFFYVATNMAASALVAAERGWRYLPLLPFVYGIMHFSYGAGFVTAVVTHGWNYVRKALSRGKP